MQLTFDLKAKLQADTAMKKVVLEHITGNCAPASHYQTFHLIHALTLIFGLRN